MWQLAELLPEPKLARLDELLRMRNMCHIFYFGINGSALPVRAGLEAKFWRGQVKFAAENLTPGLWVKNQSSLVKKSVPSPMLLKCRSPPLCKEGGHNGRGKQEDRKRRQMGENAPASLSAERNKSETMAPLFSKTRNLGLKTWIATKSHR